MGICFAHCKSSEGGELGSRGVGGQGGRGLEIPPLGL